MRIYNKNVGERGSSPETPLTFSGILEVPMVRDQIAFLIRNYFQSYEFLKSVSLT
jgi:hypothetical protein